MNDKKYNVLDVPLRQVTSENIKFSDNDRKKYNKNLQQVLDGILKYMKTDETFKSLYTTNWYAGSSYENLKISQPDEFDINLIFVWPPNSCQVVYDEEHPGYVKLKINLDDITLKKMRADAPNFDKKLNKWIDSNGFFLRNQFKSWIQGLVVKALNIMSFGDTEIKVSESGPAVTLNINHQPEQLKYSVDLVPAFQFGKNNWPAFPVRALPTAAECKDWTVVPKESKSEKQPVYWKMSFYRQEKELMNDRLVMKHIIKLIKLLRDKGNWSLYSYAIKSVFLWECETTTIEFWKKGLGSVFMYMLKKLTDYLARGEIPYYWDRKLNLIEKMKDIAKKNLKDRIYAILKHVDANLHSPYEIKKYFGCAPEKLPNRPSEVLSSSDVSLIDLDIPDSCLPLTISPASSPQNERLSEGETKREVEKTNVNVQSSGECNNETGKGLNFVKDSIWITEILSMILKEQQEIKQTLQNICKQLNELHKEVRIQQEIVSSKEQVHINKNENSMSPSPVESLLALSNLNISNTSNDGQWASTSYRPQPAVRQQHSSALLDGFTNNTSTLTGISSTNSQFSDLVDFASNDMQPKQNNQDLMKM